MKFIVVLLITFIVTIRCEQAAPVTPEATVPPDAATTEQAASEGETWTRTGTPSTGPCPAKCKCFANEEACGIFVDCHNVGLTDVPTTAEIDPNADCIDLSQNSLKPAAGMFSHLPSQLAYLELHGNKLGEGNGIPGSLFTRLNKLVHLGLEQNGLTTLPSDLLSGLNNLKVLYLSHNELNSLPANLFSSTPDLRVLLLQHNKIQTVPDGVFANMQKLKVLKLSDNEWSKDKEANATYFNGLNLFQLDLKEDKGDYYEDAMLEGLQKMSDLGQKEIDEEQVKKQQEQGKIDEDLFNMEDMSGDDMEVQDSDADAFNEENNDNDGDATSSDDGDATTGKEDAAASDAEGAGKEL